MTIARGQMNRQLYQDGSRGIKDLMEGKISDDEIRNIISVLEDVDIVDEDVMSDEDMEVMENLRLKQMAPEYQYDEENPYTGREDNMRAKGGITNAPISNNRVQAFGGFSGIVSGIGDVLGGAAKGIGSLGKSVVKGIGDVAKNIDIEDALAVAAMFTPAAPYVGPTYAAAGGDNPFIQAATMFGKPGGGFGFPGQTPPTFPTGGGQNDGLASLFRLGTQVLKGTSDNTDTDEEARGGIFGDEWEITPDGKIRKKGTQLALDVNSILEALGLTKKEAIGGAAATGLAALTYADRKRLIEKIEKDIAAQRENVGRFREKFRQTAGTGRATGAPTSTADVVRRPANMGGVMDLDVRTNPQGVQEIDYREKGGFVPPIGIKEKADDIPAMLSNNEFVFTADAVRAAGGGSVNKGAQKMYALMKQLEGQA